MVTMGVGVGKARVVAMVSASVLTATASWRQEKNDVAMIKAAVASAWAIMAMQ